MLNKFNIKSLPGLSSLKELFKNNLSKLGILFKKSASGFTGINVGSHYLKGLSVENGKIVGYFIEENQGLSQAVEKLRSANKAPPGKVKLCLKNPACLVRYFSFPKMEKKKLSQALFYELSKFIPFPAEEVYFDFFILGDAGPKEYSILLAAARKELVNQVLEDFSKSGFVVSDISLDSVCLVNLFLNNYEQSKGVNACILDIGHKYSSMTLLHKGVPFITRDLNFNAEDVFSVAARVKGVGLAEIKEQVVLGKQAGEFLELAADSISSLCTEMKNSFDYFEVNKGERVDKLYLSGGLASVDGIANSFKEILETETEILQVFAGNARETAGEVFFDKKFELIKNSFSAAFGLVL